MREKTCNGQTQTTRMTTDSGPHPLNEAVESHTARVLITGICAVLDHQDSWLIVTPDGGPAHRSRNYEDRVIPRHTPWLLTTAEALHVDSRTADFEIGDYVLFVLERERLIFDTRQSRPHVEQPPDPHAIHLTTVCSQLTIAREHASVHPGYAVSAQVKLPRLRLEQAARTELEFEFRPKCPDTPHYPAPRQISHIGKVTIPVGGQPFSFTSSPFDDVPPLKPILFRGLEGNTGVIVVIGNTPIGAVRQWITPGDVDDEEGPDVDFELYYELAPGNGPHVRTIPFGRKPRTGTASDPLPRVGNCPYVIGTVADEVPNTTVTQHDCARAN